MANETRQGQGAPSRKHDVDALFADLDVKPKDAPTSRKSGSYTRPPEQKAMSNRHQGEAQSLLDDLEGLVQRRRSSQRDRDTDPSQAQNMAPFAPASQTTTQKSHAGMSPVRPAQRVSPSPTKSNVNTPDNVSNAAVRATTSTAGPVRSSQIESRTSRPTGLVGQESLGLEAASKSSEPATVEPVKEATWGKWGSNIFNTASKFAEQARDEIGRRTAGVVPQSTRENESHPEHPIYDIGNKFAQQVRGFMQDGSLENIRSNLTAAGKRGWNDIVNAVVMPMDEHESLDIIVSHDMAGYDGVETLIFKVLERVFSRADVDVSVTRDMSIRTTPDDHVLDRKYDLHAASSREEGVRYTKDALRRLCASIMENVPATQEGKKSTCSVLLRIQPFLGEVLSPGEDDLFMSVAQGKQAAERSDNTTQALFFLLWWVDPVHKLSHITQSQAVPAWWTSVPDAENQWVEQALGDILEGAVAVVAKVCMSLIYAKDYLHSRAALVNRAIAESQSLPAQ